MSEQYEKEVRQFLGPRGPLARLLPGYECRPEQADMAGAVLRALAGKSISIVEAGTGTGKTLAYLVPAIYSGDRVVISTGTKALQEQLMNKDLPVLSREFNIRAALMKGRTNYLCWKRFHEFGQQPTFNMRDEIRHYEMLLRWAEETETGDRAEITGLPDDFGAWREMSASSEQCTGQKCEFFDDCFVMRMRAMGQQADIVVANHHLFFADMALRGTAPASILPDYRVAILDEAHGLAEVATEYFGVQVSTWRVLDLSRDVRRIERASQIQVDDLRRMLKALDGAEFAANAALGAVADYRRWASENGEGARFSMEPLRKNSQLIEEGERAVSALKLLAQELSDLGKKDEAIGYMAERAKLLADDMAFVLAQDDDDHVYWAEVRGRGVTLRASPAELGPILTDKLFGKEMPLVFTSATLAVQNRGKWSFDHFCSELGLTDAPRKVEELCLPSSYDWKENAMLYVPRHLPEPTDGEFIVEAAREMLRIVRISQGRAFLLFTSYRNMEAAFDLLAPHLDYLVLKQGDGPKSELLETFRKDERSVLFATQSFWEGVDVSGQSLSCVIVDKLPFASPGDPLTSARINRIKRKGGNPFMDYQLPAAVIALKQGLGRLIRTKKDYGILAVLDVRLHTKRYGKTFMSSLPPAPLTSDLAELQKFFARHEGKGGGEAE